MTALRGFTDDDLEQAAALLAARHDRHRRRHPLLGPVDALGALGTAWAEASGGVATTDASGAIRGYLLWRLRENDVWGRFAWVDRAGHASPDPEVTRELYAEAARGWVADGVTRHAVVVPATTDDLDPWERLAFARMQLHALRTLPADAPPSDPRIRPSGPDDVDRDVAPFAAAIWQHQAASPAFTGLAPPPWEELRTDWIATVAEPGAIHLVLEADGAPAGHVLVYAADDELGWPPRTARLAVVAVAPEQRGRGVGRALTEAAFGEARRAGFEAMETDWRITNLQSSRTWPALGFVPVFHRLWRVTGTG